MPLIQPFAALRPAPGRAADVIAPPYDVVSTEEARALAAGRPWSFLHVSRPEIDLPPGTDPHGPEAYAKAAESLRRMVEAGVLVRDPQPRLYVYGMEAPDGHRQTGLVAVASVEAYREGRIRRHEHTRPDKEADRARQIEAVNAQTGPVLLACRAGGRLDALLAAGAAGEPAADAVDPYGVRHRLWLPEDPAWEAEALAAAEALDALYVADGHHRSAAAARVAERRRAERGPGPWDWFLAVVFPHDQMRILDYNRIVRDLGGLGPEAFLEAVRARGFAVEPAAEAVRPAGRGEFGMYLAGRWHRLRLDPARIPDDPVGRLDVSLLHRELIEPVLGIADPRRDPRIDFVGGSRGLDDLAARVDAGEAAVAFSLHPTAMEDLLAVADAGEVMPPKSTWFDPKLADGLASHVLD